MTSNHLLLLGYGYTAKALAARLRKDGWRISATFRNPMHSAAEVDKVTFPPLEGAGYTHLLSSIPPGGVGDPALPLLPEFPQLQWAGYLSATSVYGNHNGAWVDENSTCQPTSARGQERLMAEQQWLNSGLPAHIFRLTGIYGPGRSAIDDVRAGTAKRTFKPGQFFSRIHVEDIAQVLMASMNRPNPGAIYNVADDEPAPSHEVVAYACQLLGREPPPLVDYAQALLSPMAQSFYADNKRISNRKIKDELGVKLLYPTYREGLQACHTPDA